MNNSNNLVNLNTSKKDEFVRKGPVMDITSYPEWAQQMVAECADAKQRVREHKLFKVMADASVTHEQHRNLLIGYWPVIDQFPQYMAMNLLKTPYGISNSLDMARNWLIRNIRVEANHGKYWHNWAEASDISTQDMVGGRCKISSLASTLSHWCWQICATGDLFTAMAATNYAIEGVTGEWAYDVFTSDDYQNMFNEKDRAKALKWLSVHAEYDDIHPWEALEIICTGLGNNPAPERVEEVKNAVLRSYELMEFGAEQCMTMCESSEKVSDRIVAA